MARCCLYILSAGEANRLMVTQAFIDGQPRPVVSIKSSAEGIVMVPKQSTFRYTSVSFCKSPDEAVDHMIGFLPSR